MITKKEFRQLADCVKIKYGIHLKEEKRGLVTSRLSNVLLKHKFNNFTDYLKYLESDQTGEAIKTLINNITTNYTFFMREADHFYYFRDKVLPYLTKNAKNNDLRIWSAGCSTGEEPSTLAMIMDEFFGAEKALWDTRILATDISSRALDIAARGIYKNEGIATLPANWRFNYFRKINAQKSQLVDKIRNEIIYREFNLTVEVFPFKRKFDVIFCRNVMIYFDNKTKDELVQKFYDITSLGGYLFIGHSEFLNREKTEYKYIMPAIYRKE